MYQRPPRSDELYHWIPFRGSKENQEYDPEKEKNLLQRMKNDEVEKRRKRKEEASLEHAGPKGSVVGNKQPDKFKYMAKVGEGKDTRYFYSQEELDAYKKSLSKDELAKTNIQMMTESQADMELIDKNALQKSLDAEKAASSKKKVETKQEESKEETEDKDKKKSGSGGGKGKGGGSGKVKGKGKGKSSKDKEESEEKDALLKIGKMSDKELAEYLNKNPKLAERLLKDLGIKDLDLSKGLTAKNLTKAMSDAGYLDKNETIYDSLHLLGYANKPNKKSVKHSDDDITSLMTYSAELYHYGRKGMKWYQHIYGPVQSVAKYAKKAGTKMAEAKQKHDTKAEAKWEAKKEKVIRSGNAKAIRKISNKLTDDELRRADSRINEKNRLDSMTGRQQQGQQFVQQKGNQNSSDVISDFNSFVNKATSTYNSIDKIVKTYDDLQKYMPENRAKEAKKKAIMNSLDVDGFLANPELFSGTEKMNFQKANEAYKKVFNSAMAGRDKSTYSSIFGSHYDANTTSDDTYSPSSSNKSNRSSNSNNTGNRKKAPSASTTNEYQQYMNDNRDAILDYWDMYNRN